MRLVDSPLHMRTLAKLSAEYHRLMLVTFYVSYVLGASEHGSSSSHASHALEALTPQTKLLVPLLRVMTQLAKAYVCKQSVSLLFSCMEALGGVGYLYNEEQEHLNISRIYRDTCVLPIWEGTTDVLCTDQMRALKHPRTGADSIAALDQLVRQASAFEGNIDRPRGWDPVEKWTSWRTHLEDTSQAGLMGEAREVAWALGDLIAGLLLYVDAGSDGSPVVTEMLLRFLEDRREIESQGRGTLTHELSMDLKMVFGVDERAARVAAKL
ncbi:hypothetical protein E4U42_006517 [Claviceps africana]|uniref:Acyl-CoA dehydrogenase/oxidase C-terminal domain-containing protein n=1 Tax=Claviceps africana TaxID=83212 RepID=A0A8K0J2A3_9HYPO|nr:hypothetical protein E4U42_006517 [Claviceps africana]